MPINHEGNTNNANRLRTYACTTGHTLAGRTTALPIYEVRMSDLVGSGLCGSNFTTIVKSIVKNDDKDLTNGYRQPTNHDDRLGNLPVAPGNGVAYREYYVSGNAFPTSGYIRLVADLKNKRLFITPTHYDVWLLDANAARLANVSTAIAPTAAGAQNPFFVIGGAGSWNPLFW